MTAVCRSVGRSYLWAMYVRSVVRSFGRLFFRELSRRVVIQFVDIGATIGNVLAVFIAPCDGCIGSPLVCGNR